ncbi:MAG: type II secretion system protein [Phycisphaerales bacterium]|nr:type II secretion system protein [Phycisphaerales bacterium]
MRHASTRLRSPRTTNGFTLVELVVVLGIIALLVSVLVIAVSGARESARVVQTTATMSAMSQGMVAFREDVGYLPPLLDESRGLMSPPPLDDGNIFERMQGYYSITSPAEYLLGYGHHGMDGFGWDSDDDDFAYQFGPDALDDSSNDDPNHIYQDESDRFGIRHPGADGVWTSTYATANKGTLMGRRERFINGKAKDDGPVLGPYMALPGKGVVGSLAWSHGDEDGDGDEDGHEGVGEWDSAGIDPVSGQPRVYFPGEEGYDEHGAQVICDAWGGPIRYYRLNYPGTPGRRYPSTQEPYSPSLSQFIALRPWEFEPGSATDYLVPSGGELWGDYNSTLDADGRRGDSSTTFELQSGEFAFMSGGPDRRINNWQRTDSPGVGGNDGTRFKDDWHFNWGSIPGSNPQYPVPETEEVNRDNIVEVGS